MPILPKPFVAALSLVTLAALAASLDGEPAPSGVGRHPLANQAEARFFEIFTRETSPSDAALRDLMTAYYVDPGDARTSLLLGLNHLWLAAEGDRTDPRVIENLYLAERFLARSAEQNPHDPRMPSWLVPARMSLATIEQDDERVTALGREMVEAYASDPNFHSFVVGQQAFSAPRDSERFLFGLKAMRDTGECLDQDDPTCHNHPHWPHNQEAFLVFAADFELKAGDVDRARALLEQTRRIPEFPTWPYRDVVDERLAGLEVRAAAYANADPDDDPASLFTGDHRASCQACHRTK